MWRLCWQALIPPVMSGMLIAQIIHELRHPFGGDGGGAPEAGPGNSSTVLAAFEQSGAECSALNGSSLFLNSTAEGRNSSSHAGGDGGGQDSVVYPPWALLIGWLLALGPMMIIPACALYGRATRRQGSGPGRARQLVEVAVSAPDVELRTARRVA